MDWISHVVQQLGYVGVALLTLLENLFPPIPSEVIMPMCGFLAASGMMSLPGAIAAGSIGTLAGCTGWYVLGRRIPEQRVRDWVDAHGKWLTLRCEDIDKSKDWFERHGPSAVFLGRLIPGVRTLISLPAGLHDMPAWKFLLYSAAGTTLWTTLLTVAGYVLQNSFADVEKILDPVSIAVFVSIAAWYVYRLIRNGKSHPAPGRSR